MLKFAAAGLSATGAGVQRAAGAEGLQQAADVYQNFDRALVAKQKEVAAPLVDAKQRGDAKIAEQGKKFSATMEKLNNCQVFRPVGDGGGCALTNGQQVFAFRDVLCHNCEGALGAGPKERTASLTLPLPLTLTLTLTLMMKERRPEGLRTLALALALTLALAVNLALSRTLTKERRVSLSDFTAGGRFFPEGGLTLTLTLTLRWLVLVLPRGCWG